MLHLKRHVGDRTRLTNRQTGEIIVVHVLEIVDGPDPYVLLGFGDDNHSFEIRRVDRRDRIRKDWPAYARRA